MRTPSTPPSAASRLRAALELFETGVDLMRQNLRRRHPADSAEEIERRLSGWLLERPGAEAGDCPGSTVVLETRRA